MTYRKKSEQPAEIVKTSGVLGGDPRLAGHRIGVYHIWAHYRLGDSEEDIAENVYPHLRIEQVEKAIQYAREHEDEMQEEKEERDELAKDLREEAKQEKQRALSHSCPECGGDLVGGDHAPALVECETCGEKHAVDRLLND